MGRLIDGTIQPMFLCNYILERKDTVIRILEKSDNDFLFGLLMDYFETQQTIYDVDAVIEQLNNYTLEAEKKEMNAGSFPEAQVFRGKYIAYRHSIEIVRGGGVNAKTNS